MISLCKKYYQFFLAQGLLLGVGFAFVAVPSSGMVPRYFKKNRGLATGFSVAGSSLGGVIWPIFFDQMLHYDNISFASSMRIAGFIMIPLFAITILTVRPPLKKPQAIHQDAEDGQLDEKPKKKDYSPLHRPPFVFLCAGLFFGIFGFMIGFFYVSTWATSLGMSASLAFYLVSIVNAASLFGRILPGFVSERLGRFNMLFFSCLFAGIIAFCWTTATSTAGLVVWCIAYGFASGVCPYQPSLPFNHLLILQLSPFSASS
jgi:MFS family permease